MDQSSIRFGRYQTLNSVKTGLSHKDKVMALLNSFNTGDQTPISYINPSQYVQHNLAVGDGLKGFSAAIQHAPPQGFKANVIRAFQDGNYVFTHTEYDFFGPKAGFDIFRFEDGLIVEHWDNLISVQKPNPSGHTQFDGVTTLTDLENTSENKQVVRDFVENVLLGGDMSKLTTYINPKKYIQHNPAVADGLEGFGEAMKYFAEQGWTMEYKTLHKVLGQGNFVLTVSEGVFGAGEPTAFYDLFRLENGQIVEHWDVIAQIPPRSEWKNQNGKF
ncbi:MAG: nuclear transport factor 2 family protein [Bacteroidota bacterium]